MRKIRRTGWKRALFLSFAAACVFLQSAAQAQVERERIGELAVSDFLLEPSFYYGEPQTGQFQPGNSLFGISWKRDDVISGKIGVGTQALLGQPARYGVNQPQQLAIVEGYAQATGYLGRARLGLTPIPFGIEGGDVEGHLIFPRSLFFQNRMVPLRDYGASYAVDTNGFLSEWAIHNGEAGADLDNQTWFTARWSWIASRDFKIGASAETGRTTPQSTGELQTQTDATSGIDITKNSKTRIGNLFLDWQGSPLRVAAELFLGQSLQDGNTADFNAGHIDLSYSISQEIEALARYDQFNAQSDLLGASYHEEATVGFGYRLPYETSVIYVYGSKDIQSGAADAHTVRIVWRLTPFIGPLN